MYNLKRRIYKRVCVPSITIKEFESPTTYHPFSYYLNGGSDPTGEQLDMTQPTFGDTAEDLAGRVGVDAFADPRTNFFDVVEQVGVENANKASDAMKAGEASE